MKLLYTISGYKPAYRLGGPIISVSSLAEKMAQKGHDVYVLTTNSNLDEDIDVPLGKVINKNGVKVIYNQRLNFSLKILNFVPYISKSSGFVYAPEMKKFLRSNIQSFDLIHTHLPFIYPTYIASCFANKYNKPLFYHQRGVLDPKRINFRSIKKKIYIKAFELPILKRANTLIALTKEEKENYEKLGVKTPCRIIPNGVDIKNYRTKPKNNLLWIQEDKKVILFMGRLHPIKGAKKLIEAFVDINEKVPQAILVMAGPDEYGLESELRTLVDKKNLSKRIFFTGMVTGEIKRDLLARADIFCLPSVAEGFSMAILEAMASSTAIIASRECNFDDIECHGAGKIIENTKAEVSKSLIQFIENSDLKEMGRRGFELVRNEYSWDIIADNMIQVYEEGILRHKNIN